MKPSLRRILGTVMALLLLAVPAAAGRDYKGYAVVNVEVNGVSIVSDVPAINFDGRTMLPVRAIAEALGADVRWVAETQTVVLTTGSGNSSALLSENQTLKRRVADLEAELAALKQGTAAVPAQVEGFRGVAWGSSIADVKAKETGRLAQEEANALAYTKVEVNNLAVDVGYFFTKEGKLARGIYMVTEKHIDSRLYIDDYDGLKNLLVEKYGKPSDTKVIWRNDLYKDDPSGWGTAVAVGHLVMYSTWTTPESKIQLMLGGDNFKTNLMLAYSSLAYAGQLDEESKVERSEGL